MQGQKEDGTKKACVACEVGSVTTSPGQTSCTACRTGVEYANTGQTACDTCDLVSFLFHMRSLIGSYFVIQISLVALKFTLIYTNLVSILANQTLVLLS